MGNPILRTPNLDAIAESGMTFDNAWVSNPVCMPNRATIMTGRMPSAHGVIFNDRSLDWNANTFVRRFRSAGYRTGLLGKSHLQHGPSRNSVIPVRSGGMLATSHHPPGWDQLEDFENYVNGNAPDIEDYYGFDHVEFALEHGSSVLGHHLAWALRQGGRSEDLVVPMTEEAPGLDRSERWWQIYRAPYDPELHSTSFVADRTIAFIEDSVAQEKPFLAWASFPDPHHPMAPPGPWFDRHDPDQMPLPDSIDDAPDHLAQHLREAHGRHPRDQHFWVQPCGVAGDHGLVREAIAATYGMIEMIDDAIGRVVSTLDRLGQADDTIIVFTSDNGGSCMPGSPEKRPTSNYPLRASKGWNYEGGIRIPTFITWPGKIPAMKTAEPVITMDLYPTLLELAGCRQLPKQTVDGHSLVPLIHGKKKTLNRSFLAWWYPHANGHGTQPCQAILKDGWKLVHYMKQNETELYRLDKDEGERNDLAKKNPKKARELLETLNQWVKETGRNKK